MKKIFLLFVLVFSLSSCFNNGWDVKNQTFDKNTFKKDIIVWTWVKDNILDRIIKLWKEDYNVINNFNWKKYYCKNNSSYICSLINSNYFYIKYFKRCNSYYDINYCERLKWEKEKKYCRWDFYIKKLINKKDKEICNNFWNNFNYWNIMWSETYNNKKLCIKFYNDLISKKQITEEDISKFIKEISADKDTYNELVSILLNKNKIFSVKDAFEVNMRKWKLNCNKLNDINYIFSILSEIKQK